MAGENLYEEMKCRQCGQTHLREAGFCPHCGYVEEESWFRRIFGGGRSGGGAEVSGRGAVGGRGSLLPTLVGVVIAIVLLINAAREESLRSLIVAVIVFIFAIRTWLSARNRGEEASHRVETVAGEEDRETKTPIGPPVDRFFCENCGGEVGSDADVCPKCGMRFG